MLTRHHVWSPDAQVLDECRCAVFLETAPPASLVPGFAWVKAARS